MIVAGPQKMMSAIIADLEARVREGIERSPHIREWAANLAHLCLWKRVEEGVVALDANDSIPDLKAGMLQGMAFLPDYLEELLAEHEAKETAEDRREEEQYGNT